VIPVTGGTRMFLYRGRADMRKGFDGLSGMVEEHFSASLFSGALFIFLLLSRISWVEMIETPPSVCVNAFEQVHYSRQEERCLGSHYAPSCWGYKDG
jgi:hypothetical protein